MAKDSNSPQLQRENLWDKFLKSIPFDQRLEVEKIKSEHEFVEYAVKNNIPFPHLLWDERYFSLSLQGLPLEEEKKSEKESEKKEERRSSPERHHVVEEEKEKEQTTPEAANEDKPVDDSTKTDVEAPPNPPRAPERSPQAANQQTQRIPKLTAEKPPAPSMSNPKPSPRLARLRKIRLSPDASSFLKRKTSNASSYSARLIRRSVITPATRSANSMLGAAGKSIGRLSLRAGVAFSRLLAAMTSLVIAVLTIKVLIVVFLIVLVLVFIAVFVSILTGGLFPATRNQESFIKDGPYKGISYIVQSEYPNSAVGSEYKQFVRLYYFEEATCPIENITLVDLIPPETTLIENKTTGKFTRKKDQINNQVIDQIRWKLYPDNEPLDENGKNRVYSFDVVLRTDRGIAAQNRVYIEGCGEPLIPTLAPIQYITPTPTPEPNPGDLGDLMAGANSPPSNLTCNDENYKKIMTAIKKDFKVENANFGDPTCNFKKEKLKALLEKTETNKNNVDFWMEIARCESPNSGPNGYTRDPRTWGQFQTLEGKPVFSQSNRNGIYRGDVTWQQQVINAVNLNNVQRKDYNNNFVHWGAAMCLCWWPEHKDKQYCNDIVENGVNSTRGPRAPARNCPKGANYLTCKTAVRCTNDACRP